MFRKIPWREVCKFLAGAFSVNAGILFYLIRPPTPPTWSATPITYTRPAGSAPHRAGAWNSSHNPGSTAPSGWGNHYNAGAHSGTTPSLPGGSTTTVTSN